MSQVLTILFEQLMILSTVSHFPNNGICVTDEKANTKISIICDIYIIWAIVLKKQQKVWPPGSADTVCPHRPGYSVGPRRLRLIT